VSAVDDPGRPGRRSSNDERGVEGESLFIRYRRTGDLAARNQLILEHENLVRFLAAKFANRGEPLDDLVQVGVIGLIHAIDRFEPDRGLKFSTFATPTIVGEIKRHFRDRAWNLKVPRWLQDLNVQAARASEALTQELGRSPTVAEVASRCGCTEEQALNAMELGSAYETVSLDQQLSLDGDAAQVTLSDVIGGQDQDLDQIGRHADLEQAFALLDGRERLVLYLRYFQELSQTDVAARLGISQMHVSRIQNRALRRLRRILTEEQIRQLTRAA